MSMVNTLLHLGPSSQGKLKYPPGVLGHGQRVNMLFADQERLSRGNTRLLRKAIKSLTNEIWERGAGPNSEVRKQQ